MSAHMDIFARKGAASDFSSRRPRHVSPRQSSGVDNSTIHPYISNGTCYSAAGMRMSDDFIPCGNDYYGPESCCWAGDLCLDQHACFSEELDVVYLAGCTDEEYQRDSCPNKGDYGDDPWVGLGFCKGDPNEWIYCPQSDAPTGVTTANICLCPTATSARTPAFTHSQAIEILSSLPSAEGGTILQPVSRIYVNGSRWPTSPAAITSSSSSAPHSVSSTAAPAAATITITASPTAAVSSSAAAEQPSSANGSGRAGMIAGSVLGVSTVLFAGVLAFLYFCVIRPRRQQSRQEKQAGLETASFSPEEFDPYEVAGHSSDLPRPGPVATSATPVGSGSNPYYLPVADAASYHNLTPTAEAYLPVAHMGPPRPKFELDAGPLSFRSELDGSSTDVSQMHVPRPYNGTPTSFEDVPLDDDSDVPLEDRVSPVKSPVSALSAQRGTMYSVVSSQFSVAGPSESVLATADAADATRHRIIGEEEEEEARGAGPRDRPLSSMFMSPH